MTEKNIAKLLLHNLKIWKKKPIKKIKVHTSLQTFWVSDPDKIKYWMTLSEKMAARNVADKILPSIRILKVVHDEKTA